MADKDMSKRFLNGLEARGYGAADLKQFKFCGIATSEKQRSDHVNGIHDCVGLNYFQKIGARGRNIPEYVRRCICGTKFKANAYIIHCVSLEILTIGKDCCEKFVAKIAPMQCQVPGCLNTTKHFTTGLCSFHRSKPRKSKKAMKTMDVSMVSNVKISDAMKEYMDVNTNPNVKPADVIVSTKITVPANIRMFFEATPAKKGSITVSSCCIECDKPKPDPKFKYCGECVRKQKMKQCDSCYRSMLATSKYSKCYHCAFPH